ncbi:MAG: P22 phage major capsid protein family protein, partial [Gammaproteobacteria bacterium]
MASSLPKSIKVFFNDLIKTFNNANEMGKIVPKYKMPETEGEQSSNTVWRPTDDISASSEGRTVSAFTDVTALSVPSSLNSNVNSPSDFINSTFKLNANDLNDATSRDRKLKGVIRKISSDVDQKIKELTAKQGGIFIKETAALTSYTQLSQCEAEMSIRGIDMMEPRSMFLEPFISNAVANQLQLNPRTLNEIPTAALERNRLPMIAGFDTFKGNTMPLITAALGTGYLTNQAAVQKHIPKGNDAG